MALEVIYIRKCDLYKVQTADDQFVLKQIKFVIRNNRMITSHG